VSDTNGHKALSALLEELTRPQLERLDRALKSVKAEPIDKLDLYALVDEIRALPPLTLSDDGTMSNQTFFGPTPRAPIGSDQWRREIDGGRAYELLLMLLDQEQAAAQHKREWSEVDAMVAGSLTHKQAWERIRLKYGDAAIGFIADGASSIGP
jgi:hypothetical protein